MWFSYVHEEPYLVIFTPSTFTMPKKSWASKEQQDWLYDNLPDFRLAQEAKSTPSFFSKLYEDFHAKWPLAPLTAEEIAADQGNPELAQTNKEKASETVSNGFLHMNY